MGSILEDLIDLEQLDSNLFRSRFHIENFRQTLFGGQVLGQALAAMFNTLDSERLPNSLHAYFLRPGSSEAPVIYDVESVRDGKSFSSRRAVARQFGRPIFNMSCSFHKEEPGYHHQDSMPSGIPQAQALKTSREANQNPKNTQNGAQGKAGPFELLAIDDNLFNSDEAHEPEGFYWMKAFDKVGDSPLIHYCSLAFASDFGLLATALLPHKASIFGGKIFPASIDHAMWFHNKNFRIDEWLLCRTYSPWAGNARGFAKGSIFNESGDLIASSAQEGLIRKLE